MKILAIPLASTLHGEQYYLSVYKVFKECLENYSNIEVFDKVVTSDKDLPRDLKGYDLLLIIHLTGGTSGYAKKLVSSTGLPALLVAYGRHNSLGSGLSARSWLQYRGYRVWLLYTEEPNGFCSLFNSVYRGVYAGYGLSRLRVLEVNADGVVSEDAKRFMESLGGVVEAVGFEELHRIGSQASKEDLVELYDRVSRYMDLSGAEPGYLMDVLRVYYALRKLVVDGGYNAVSIDCFPYVVKYRVTPCLAVAMLNNDGIPTACEDDFYSLVGLALSMLLTGRPGWIANPSGVSCEGYLKLAHCTIAPGLCRNCMLVPHFETGYPYALACSLEDGEYGLLRLDHGYRRLVVYRVRHRGSGLLEPGLCRTQFHADIDGIDGYGFIEEAVGNHHVLVPWVDGLETMLKTLAWWMGWDLEVRG